MKIFQDGITEAKRGNTKLGAQLLQGAAGNNDCPEAKAWLGYCLANEKRNFSAGISLCKEALRSNPRLSDAYLALARIYILVGHRKNTIETLKQGAKITKSSEILTLQRHLGIRKKPIIPFLSRGHFINISLGRLVSSVGSHR